MQDTTKSNELWKGILAKKDSLSALPAKSWTASFFRTQGLKQQINGSILKQWYADDILHSFLQWKSATQKKLRIL